MENHILPYEVIRFTHQQRQPESFVETNLHRLTSQGQAAAIVTHIEINNQWHPTAQIAQKIINKILQEFEHSESLSALNRFEQTLQTVNGLIEESAEKLETPIAVAVIFLKGNAIYFSAAGPSRLLIHRQKRILDLHKSNKQTSTTFAEVTSGDLSPTDWLIVGNENFASILSSCPNTYWGDSSCEQVIEDIKIGAKNAESSPTCGVILRFSADPQIKTVIWEDSRTNEASESTLVLKERLSRISKVPKIIFENTSRAASSLLLMVRNTFTRVTQPNIPEMKPPELPPDTSPSSPAAPVAATALIGALPAIAFLRRILLSLKNPFRLLRIKFNTRFLFFVMLIAVIITIGLSYQRLRTRVINVPEQENFLTNLQNQENSNYLNYLASNFDYLGYQDLTQEDKKSVSTLLAATKIELITPILIAQLPKTIEHLATSSDYKVAIDEEGQLWQLQTPVKKIEQSRLLTTPLSIVSFTSDTSVISDEAGNIWLTTPTPTSPTALALPSGIATGSKKIEKFSNNLYVFAAATKTIYRVNGFNNEITAVTKIATVENDISDWTINGDIVTIDNVGTINSYKRGSKTNLSISLPFLAKSKITSSQLNNIIAVATARFLFLYNNEGVLQRTIFLPSESPINDLDFDAVGTLWLSSDKNIYQVKI